MNFPTFQRAPPVLQTSAGPSRLHSAAAQTPQHPSSADYHFNLHSSLHSHCCGSVILTQKHPWQQCLLMGGKKIQDKEHKLWTSLEEKNVEIVWRCTSSGLSLCCSNTDMPRTHKFTDQSQVTQVLIVCRFIYNKWAGHSVRPHNALNDWVFCTA